MKEESIFRATFRVTPESCHALAKAKSSQHQCAVWLCNAVIALGVVILWVVGSRSAVWMTAVLALVVFNSLMSARLTAWRLYGSRNSSVDVTKLKFDSKGIHVHSRVEESLLRYDQITGLRRDGKYLMIYLKHHTPLVVSADEVEDGRADELEAFLMERTGEEVRSLHRR